MKIVKTSLISWSATLLLTIAGNVHADPFSDFKNQVTDALLKPFAKDLGGIIGAGSFHTGRSLGFPGVDAGVHFAIQSKPDKSDMVLKNANIKAFGLPIVQGEIGLPFNIDVILRGVTVQEVAMVGGGLRYGLFKLKMIPLSPGIAVSALGNVLNHNYFSINHQAVNIMADLSVPIVSPYLGIGFDRTKIKIKEASSAALVGLEASATGTRLTLGVNIKPLPLVYIHGAATRFNGNTGYEGGAGVKF